MRIDFDNYENLPIWKKALVECGVIAFFVLAVFMESICNVIFAWLGW